MVDPASRQRSLLVHIHTQGAVPPTANGRTCTEVHHGPNMNDDDAVYCMFPYSLRRDWVCHATTAWGSGRHPPHVVSGPVGSVGTGTKPVQAVHDCDACAVRE